MTDRCRHTNTPKKRPSTVAMETSTAQSSNKGKLESKISADCNKFKTVLDVLVYMIMWQTYPLQRK